MTFFKNKYVPSYEGREILTFVLQNKVFEQPFLSLFFTAFNENKILKIDMTA